MHSFRGLTPPQEVLDAVQRGEIASFCLFGYNVESPAQVRAMCEQIRNAAQRGGQPVPLIGIDQEGGQLMAVSSGVSDLPGNMALGATRDPELAYLVGMVLAKELRAIGINLNFAPSVDVNTNFENPGMGVRSFGDDPRLVADLGAALVRGMQDQGVIATAKHFPGMGASAGDTHHTSTTVDKSIEQLEAQDLLPFRAVIKAGVGAIMSSHVIMPQLDPDNPATLSHAVMTELLRGRLDYSGLLITDAMDMYAVSQFGALASTQRALAAGIDLVLLGHLEDKFSLMRALAGTETEEARKRIRNAQRFADTRLLPFDTLNNEEHRAIGQRVAEHAITVVKGADHLPLHPQETDVIAVITPEPVNVTPADTTDRIQIGLAGSVSRRHRATISYELPARATPNDIAAILEGVSSATIVIEGTSNAYQDVAQATLVRELIARGKQPVVVAMRMPHDLQAFPNVEVYVCTYSLRPVALEAAARVLFGEIAARGRLPVALPLTQ
ncbi:MAG: glycoside hydrolase family 3 N-terminal domain-containing protein [Anaerolineae bacterium]